MGLKVGKIFSKVLDVDVLGAENFNGRIIRIFTAVNVKESIPRGTTIKLGREEHWIDFRMATEGNQTSTSSAQPFATSTTNPFIPMLAAPIQGRDCRISMALFSRGGSKGCYYLRILSLSCLLLENSLIVPESETNVKKRMDLDA